MPSLTEGLKIDAQGNVVSAPPKPAPTVQEPVKPAVPTPAPTLAPAPLMASSTQSRQQFGKDQETFSKFATELEVARQQALQIKQNVDQMALKESSSTAPGSSMGSNLGAGAAPGAAKPQQKDSTTQIAEYNKKIGRKENDSTGISIRPDGSIDFSGVPESMQSVEQVNSDVDRDTDDAIAQLGVFQQRFEATTQAMIADIQRRYEIRREQVKDTNMRYLRGLTSMGHRSGRARYAPEIQSGILASEERAGLARLAELDAEEMSLIAEAQAAQDEKDFAVFNQRVSLLAEKRKEKNDEAQRLFKNAVDFENLAIARAEEAREAEKFGFEQEEAGIQSIAFGVMNMLTGDQEADLEAVSEIANIYGYDPNKLYVAAQQMQNEQRQKDFALLSGPTRDYMSALESGTIPQDMSLDEYLNLEDPTRPYKAEGAELDIESKKVGIEADKVGIEATKLGMDATRLAMEKTRVDIAKGLQELAENDISSGNLSDKDIKNIDNSPQGKNLLLLQDLQSKTTRYKTLVEQYGTQMVGQGRTLLENAYSELQIAWKEAAKLGALQGADLDLLSNAVKPATGIGAKIGGVFTGGASGIISGLKQMEERINTDANRSYDQLLTRNSKYGNSDYVQGLAQPFKRTFNIDGQTFIEGDIIEVNGQRGRIEKDGTVTPVS